MCTQESGSVKPILALCCVAKKREQNGWVTGKWGSIQSKLGDRRSIGQGHMDTSATKRQTNRLTQAVNTAACVARVWRSGAQDYATHFDGTRHFRKDRAGHFSLEFVWACSILHNLHDPAGKS